MRISVKSWKTRLAIFLAVVGSTVVTIGLVALFAYGKATSRW